MVERNKIAVVAHDVRNGNADPRNEGDDVAGIETLGETISLAQHCVDRRVFDVTGELHRRAPRKANDSFIDEVV